MSFPPYKTKTSEQWIKEYEKRDALWIHDGNPRRPHVKLRSGEHSNGFFNSELVLQDPMLMDEVCCAILTSIMAMGQHLSNIKRIVGPAMGAITIAHDVARHVTLRTGGVCFRAYTQKAPDGTMMFERTEIDPKDRIILVEDVITKGGSVMSTAAAVEKAGGIILPYVGAIVNRSGLHAVGGKAIVALITHHMPKWSAEECPLCAVGSGVVSDPKKNENWARLNMPYD
ncbi:MAG: hypothetical protein V4686_00495 [Patescibacteria group bacterium]